MAKNIYIYINSLDGELYYKELKGEIKSDTKKAEHVWINKDDDEVENLFNLDDESLINLLEFEYDNNRNRMQNIYSLSTNLDSNKELISKRADNLRKLLKDWFC